MTFDIKITLIFLLRAVLTVSASNGINLLCHINFTQICYCFIIFSVCEVTDTQRFSALENPCIPIVNYRFLIPPEIVKNATALKVPNQYLLQLQVYSVLKRVYFFSYLHVKIIHSIILWQAQKLLNLGSLKLFSGSCQAAYLSLVCSTIYQKCFVDQKNNSA